MLKKFFAIILVLTFIVGCTATDEGAVSTDEQDTEQTSEQDNTNNNTEDQPEQQEQENEQNDTSTDENKEDSTENNGQEDQGTTEDQEEDAVEDPVEPVEPVVEPQYYVNQNWMIKPIGDANPKVLLLTIDDAPDEHAVEMAKILKELEVNALFFVNGHFIDTDEEKQVLKEIYDMGFTIGNHTLTHAYLWWKENGKRYELSEDEQYVEIINLNDIIEEVIGEKPKFFRAPFGQNTDYATQLVKQEDMVLMNWSVGSLDWQYKDAASVRDQVLDTLHSGGNILLHDREWSKDALREIVIGAREQGYEFVDPKLITFPEE